MELILLNLKEKLIFILLGPLLFLIIFLTGPYDGMSLEAHAVLASSSWIAIWWITEAVPIPVTSLLPLVLFPLSGGLEIGPVGEAYGNKIIFLFLGGFIIAIAIEKWNLHKRIALTIISFMGTSMDKMVLGFMIATAFLSMWISNTATSVMMLPIGVAIIKQFSGNEEGSLIKQIKNSSAEANFGKVLMLGIAYSASIGGMATLIGTPPNLVLAGVVTEFYDTDIGFLNWFLFASPLSLILLFIAWIYLVKIAFPVTKLSLPGGKNEINKQLIALGKISFEEKVVLVVFILTAIAWITRSFILNNFIPGLDDSIIAIMGACILFLLPTTKKRDKRILDWSDTHRVPWGIILLFGGGLAVAAGFSESGLAHWIASRITILEGVSLILLLLILITMVNFLTEITSNTATTAMLLPILVPVALSMDVHPYAFLFGAALAASCAFMLPVATPPNAVVFGSGYLRMKDMVRTGILMNLISIVLILIYIYWVLPFVWDIEIGEFPNDLKNL